MYINILGIYKSGVQIPVHKYILNLKNVKYLRQNLYKLLICEIFENLHYKFLRSERFTKKSIQVFNR